MEYEFYDKYILDVDATPNNVSYQFITPEGKKAKVFNDKRDPLEIGPRTSLGVEILKHIEPEGKYRTKALVEKEFEEIMMSLSEMVESIIIAKNEAEETIKELEADVIKDQINDGYTHLDETDVPLLWIAHTIDWLTAGERDNILYAFLAYASQVILRNPISVIGIGDGGSGKTHIQDLALSLMPDEFVLQMKSSTMAAVYAMSERDPYYFDGKIVNMGDMGGSSDHEEAEEFKNIMKEMQSDGYVKRIKMVKGDDGEQIPKDFELFGKPCLTYTNVPGFEYDDQEKSRSVFFQPRVDNDKAVSVFKRLHDMKGTKTEETINQYKERVPEIQKMLLALRDRMETIRIENPYGDFLDVYLADSKYFKRDVDKFKGILKIVTAINGYKRPRVDNTLFTTKEDIKIFIDILQRYRESITANLTPGASDLLQELRDNAEQWDLYEDGISVNDYMYKSRNNLAKNSARRYFSELNAASYLKVIDTAGRVS